MDTRLYIGKLGNLTKQELVKICGQYGTVKDFMMKDMYAFVEYSSEQEAKSAQLELDGRSINGQRILVEPAKPKTGDSGHLLGHPRLYVGRITSQVSQNDLVNLFSKYGEIIDILMKDDFAFLEFANSKQAQNALKELNGYSIGGSRLVVEAARPKEEDQATANLLQHPRLYVGKLNESVKKQDLVNAFSQYGDILDILMKDDFAFLEFSNIQAATKALLDMNGAKLCGSKIVVEEAKPREGERHIAHHKSSHGPGGRFGGERSHPSARRRLPSRKRRSPYRSLSRSRSAEKESSIRV